VPPNNLTQLLDLAKSTAIQAGKEVLKIYNSGNYDSYAKDDESPVTSADYKANEIISDALRQHQTDIPIMSEETNNGDLEARKNWTHYWLIDPIDGTQEFIAGSGDFAINIALISENQPVLGVIYWPVGDTLYYATKGQGAFKQTSDGIHPIHVRKLDDPTTDDIIIAISRRQSKEQLLSKMSEERTYETKPLGSCSLKSCFIAEGKADIYLRLGITGEWDTGAPQCIVSEAGGKILAANFEPLTYNKRQTLTNPDFVVLGDQRVDWRSIVLHQL
jgi:3'(2'), 5'-bisphosphate nucleotidase